MLTKQAITEETMIKIMARKVLDAVIEYKRGTEVMWLWGRTKEDWPERVLWQANSEKAMFKLRHEARRKNQPDKHGTNSFPDHWEKGRQFNSLEELGSKHRLDHWVKSWEGWQLRWIDDNHVLIIITLELERMVHQFNVIRGNERMNFSQNKNNHQNKIGMM